LHYRNANCPLTVAAGLGASRTLAFRLPDISRLLANTTRTSGFSVGEPARSSYVCRGRLLEQSN
jgi:hypothetical protein